MEFSVEIKQTRWHHTAEQKTCHERIIKKLKYDLVQKNMNQRKIWEMSVSSKKYYSYLVLHANDDRLVNKAKRNVEEMQKRSKGDASIE